jgi:hypothetical protein
MRHRLASICLVASALLMTPTLAEAQKKPAKPAAAAADPGKKGDGKKGDKKGAAQEINLDEEAPPQDEGPVTAGQMTEEAAQAKRLFDAERWAEAALVLKRVVDGETGDDEGTSRSLSITWRSRSTACSSTRRATASSPRSPTSRTT